MIRTDSLPTRLSLKKTTAISYLITACQKEPSCKWMNCLLAERSKRKSVWCTQRQNGTFSVESILIIWDALLMWASLVRSVEQKQSVNRTRCCFLFTRNSRSLTPLPRPSEVQWTVSRGCEMDCWSGWLKFRQTTKVCHGYSLLDDGLEIPSGAC